MTDKAVPELIDLSCLNPFVRRAIKLKMMDLVLAWARLDASIAQLAAAQFVLEPSVGAIIFGKMGVSDRLNRMRELNLQLGREPQAKALRQVRKDYEDHIRVRNLVTHSTLAGSMPDGRLVFMSYQSIGKLGQLPVDLVPIADIDRSLKWGRAICANIDKMLKEAEDSS